LLIAVLTSSVTSRRISRHVPRAGGVAPPPTWSN